MKLVSLENLSKYNELLNQKTVRSVNNVQPDSNGNVTLNVVKSINGNTPSANGDVELDTVSDITLSGKNLNIKSTDGNTKTLTLPFSDVKTEINNVPDSEGNAILSITKSVNVNSPISGNVTTEAGKVKTVNNIQPDEHGNIALNYVKTVNNIQPDENGNVVLSSESSESSESHQSTDSINEISIDTHHRYHEITLNTSKTTLKFIKNQNSENNSTVIKLELFIKQGTGTNTVTWPSNIKWENGIEPVLSLEKDHVDLISLISLDNGQNYYGFAKAVWMN